MSDSWQVLREAAEQYVDRQIGDERDPEARAVLAFNRARLVDQIELAMLRAMLADGEIGALPVNGYKVGPRVFKVVARS